MAVAQFAQDADCSADHLGCDAGLICAEEIVEVGNDANEQTICIPEASCGVDDEYADLSGTVVFDIEGYIIEDGSCVAEEEPPFQ